MAGYLKKLNSKIHIIFLGRNYTRDVVSLSNHVDEFLSWDDVKDLPEKEQVNVFSKLEAESIIHVFPVLDIARIAAKAHIPVRIGSTGRLYHYRYCNKLVPLSRRNSDLHEAQLNFKLLKPITGSLSVPPVAKVSEFYDLNIKVALEPKYEQLIDKDKFNLVLHPKSKGSAREWPLGNYSDLIRNLPEDKFKVFVTGTDQERRLMSDFLIENKDRLTDLTGEFSLAQFICFISKTDGLVAASTGPLHIAASLGKLAIGIYPPIRPMHPGRWAPIGNKARYLVADKECNDCRRSGICHCMADVTPDMVKELLLGHA
jgi:ADP-heptose:LPS heptosyltransferase